MNKRMVQTLIYGNLSDLLVEKEKISSALSYYAFIWQIYVLVIIVDTTKYCCNVYHRLTEVVGQNFIIFLREPVVLIVKSVVVKWTTTPIL